MTIVYIENIYNYNHLTPFIYDDYREPCYRFL